MLNAVWVAVIVAAGFWVVGVCAAVVVLARVGRLVSEASTAVSGLRERGDQLIERAGAAIDRSDEQLARTDAITASLDEVTANMAELTGRVAALAPLARVIAGGARSPLARVPALVYGVSQAVQTRRERRPSPSRPRAGRSRGAAGAGRSRGLPAARETEGER